jgi:hypothetical protein
MFLASTFLQHVDIKCFLFFIVIIIREFRVDDVPAATIQQAAQVVKGAAQVDMRNIYMPVFMGAQWLYKTGSLSC